MSHRRESYHTWISRITHQCRIWIRHVARENTSCRTGGSHIIRDWVVSHTIESCLIRIGHVAREWVVSCMNESCHMWVSHVAYEWVMSHKGVSYHTRMTPVTYGWVVSHLNGSCHAKMSHVTHTWLIFGCFGTTFEVNTSRHILVMLNMDCSTSPPTGWSFLGVVQSQEAGGTDCNETLVTRLN